MSKALVIATSENKDHAVFGASGSKRWMTCHGSIALSQGMPNFESKYAIEGTLAHSCLEVILNNRFKIEAAIKLAKKNKKYNDDMIKHAVWTTNYVMGREKEDKFGTLFVEEKIDSSKFTRPGEFGTADIGLAQPRKRRLVMMDYKYGAGLEVEVEDNSQVIYYALGLLLKLGPTNFDTVEIVVIQPRVDDPIKTILMTVEEVLSWGYKFKSAVKECLKPDAKLVAGDHCQFCPAAIKCPEIKLKACKDAAIVFDDGAVKATPSIKELRPDQLAKAMIAADKLETWIKAVREHAFLAVKNGKKLPGYKLVERRRTRKWEDPAKALATATKVLGDEALTDRKLLSPAQLEKKFPKSKAVKAFVAKSTTNKAGGYTLAKKDDKRKEVSRPIEAIFDVVESEDADV